MRAAVVGVGNMGKHHARVYSEMPGIELVAIVDKNGELGRSLAARFKCAFYEDMEEMLSKENIDLASLAVPTSLHKMLAMKLIERGVNVLIEKPIASTIEDAEEILAAAKEKGVIVSVGHIERHNPAVRKLKELIDAGRLGDITSVMARRVGLFPPQIKDADVIIDLAVHDIDVFNYLLGSVPENVIARGGNALINHRKDYAEMLMSYGGTNAMIQVNWITPVKIRQLSITGTKGHAELDYITQKLTLFESNYKRDFDDFGDFMVKFSMPNEVKVGVEQSEPLKEELSDFVASVRDGKEPLVSGEAGLEALKVALLARKSINGD